MELRQYGVATTLYFPLVDKGFTDFEGTPVTIASGDCKISKDGGAFANTTTASFVDETGGIYSIPLTATEMQAKQIVVKIVDQTATKEWEDQCIIITTVNHASAEIPTMWGSVQDIAASAITAASIASDAITAAKIADGAIDAGSIAADAITAAKIATGAIDADALATDAATEIAGAVWDLATSGHTTSATFGAQLKTLLDTIATYIDTEVAAIKAKTDNLPSDPADASDIAASFSTVNTKLDTIDDFIDTEVAAIKAKTDNLPSDPADASDIAAAFAVTNGKIDVVDDFLDTEIAAIKAKTDNLPTDPADQSDLAALITAVDDFVDTEVAAIKAKTDLIPAAPAAVGDIPTAIQNADAVLKRDIDNVEAAAPIHSLASMILKAVSRFKASTGATYRTDGTTIHMTQSPTTDPLADPITELGLGS